MEAASNEEVRFFSLRGLETGAADDPASPVAQLIERLQAAGVGFALDEIPLEAEVAATDPDNADLYPNGPQSGPPQLVVYEFSVRREKFAEADRVAREFTGDARAG